MRKKGARRGWMPAFAVGAALLFGVSPGSASGSAGLRAGAGRADITPPTGYYMFGWVRSDARSRGQLTRLFARAMVLQRGRRKVALVSADMGAVPNGLVADAAARAGHGFTARNVVVTASHTHSAATGYFNYPAFNTVAPTDTTPNQFEVGKPADKKLYTFLARGLARAIRRAVRDVGPAKAAWGEGSLLHVTQNRSIEAHLADHGIIVDYGQGKVSMDPRGYVHTIDPRVSVLRVDKLEGGRDVPIGMWSTFADHGTVVKPTFPYYNADHHAAAARLAERRIRRAGDVPRGQTVINSYGNSDEGDITAGIKHSGPADAFEVGRAEAGAMFRAWRRAGPALRRRPPLSLRWTRVCFCGRDTAAGPVDSEAVVGLPFLTGSEENRGPLYDETHIPFEGYHEPTSTGPQGDKIQTIRDPGGSFPTAVPLTAVRVGGRVIVTIPGEMSEGMGRRLRRAVVRAAAGSGIGGVVVSGLANDFIQYMTTPEEYGRQHYEGGSTLFGQAEGVFIEERLATLVRKLAAGRRAPPPDHFDARNGVVDDARPFGKGATRAHALRQPRKTHRLDRAVFRWSGGQRGFDRPLDRAFVRIQRLTRGRWRHADDDLGLRILWAVNGAGHYRGLWEAPLAAPGGRYRFVITANRYRLTSKPFRVRAAHDLKARLLKSGGGHAVLDLRYPQPVENRDFTWRPLRAGIAHAAVRGGGRGAAIRLGRRHVAIDGRPGSHVTVPAGALRDRYGNVNGNRLSFKL